MSHPFELKLSELMTLNLEIEESLTDAEAAQVGGGILPGGCYQPKPINWCGTPIPSDPHPPTVTTLALGEEGGCPPPVYTKALCENGGSLPW